MPNLSLEVTSLPGVDPEAVRILNDRLRRIQEELEAPLGLEANLDARGFRIVNLADPVDGRDALSRNAADRRYAPAGQAAAAAPATPGSSSSTTTTVQGDSVSVVTLTVPGTLSVRSSAAPLVSLPRQRSVSAIVALLKQPATNADLKLRVLVDGATYADLMVPKDTASAVLSAGLSPIPADKVITLDLLQVGTVFPGADLTVMLRFGQ